MTATNKYNISPMIEELAVFPVESHNFITTFLRVILAVKNVTGVNYRQMPGTKTGRNYQDVVEAKHCAMLLAYNETFDTTISERQIANEFGMASQSSVRRAMVKYKNSLRFRKAYKEVKAEYDRIVLIEYDEKIPF